VIAKESLPVEIRVRWYDQSETRKRSSTLSTDAITRIATIE